LVVAVLAVLRDQPRLTLRNGLALGNKARLSPTETSADVQRIDLMSEAFAVDLTVGTLLASEKPLVVPAL
jgi:hypothetical protein